MPITVAYENHATGRIERGQTMRRILPNPIQKRPCPDCGWVSILIDGWWRGCKCGRVWESELTPEEIREREIVNDELKSGKKTPFKFAPKR